MPDPKPQKDDGAGDRFLKAMSRFVVSLMWGLLLAVFAFVFYLISR